MTKQEYLKSKNYFCNKEENFYKTTFVFGCGNDIEYSINGAIDLALNNFYLFPDSIDSQEDIDCLQIAFNILKRDFEEVMKYE